MKQQRAGTGVRIRTYEAQDARSGRGEIDLRLGGSGNDQEQRQRYHHDGKPQPNVGTRSEPMWEDQTGVQVWNET